MAVDWPQFFQKRRDDVVFTVIAMIAFRSSSSNVPCIGSGVPPGSSGGGGSPVVSPPPGSPGPFVSCSYRSCCSSISNAESCARNAVIVSISVFQSGLSRSACSASSPSRMTIGTMAYPRCLPLPCGRRVARPTAWTISSCDFFGFMKTTASSAGTSTPCVRHCAFESTRVSSPAFSLSQAISFARWLIGIVPSMWRTETGRRRGSRERMSAVIALKSAVSRFDSLIRLLKNTARFTGVSSCSPLSARRECIAL